MQPAWVIDVWRRSVATQDLGDYSTFTVRQSSYASSEFFSEGRSRRPVRTETDGEFLFANAGHACTYSEILEESHKKKENNTKENTEMKKMHRLGDVD